MISRNFRRFAVSALLVLAVSGCRGHLPENDDPKAMAQWKQRYGDNEASSEILNSMPRDDLARVVELRKIPTRVVVLGPGSVEIVYALGLQSKLIGRDSATDFPPAAAKLPIVGDFKGPNLEQIVAANPDFVIIQGETYGEERIEAWQKDIGVPVASVAATTVAEVAQDAQKIGAWLGQKKTPNLFQNAPVAIPRSSTRKPTALFEIERQPLWAAGRDTLVADVLTQGGLANAARSVEGYKPFSLETLAAAPPDFYVVTSPNLKTESDVKAKLGAERNRVLDVLRHDAALKNLPCIKAGRVVVLPADWALRPGPRLNLAVQSLRAQVATFK